MWNLQLINQAASNAVNLKGAEKEGETSAKGMEKGKSNDEERLQESRHHRVDFGSSEDLL